MADTRKKPLIKEEVEEIKSLLKLKEDLNQKIPKAVNRSEIVSKVERISNKVNSNLNTLILELPTTDRYFIKSKVIKILDTFGIQAQFESHSRQVPGVSFIVRDGNFLVCVTQSHSSTKTYFPEEWLYKEDKELSKGIITMLKEFISHETKLLTLERYNSDMQKENEEKQLYLKLKEKYED